MSFIQVPVQGEPTTPPKPMHALAHAVLYHKNGVESWTPATRSGEGFVDLLIRPGLLKSVQTPRENPHASR